MRATMQRFAAIFTTTALATLGLVAIAATPAHAAVAGTFVVASGSTTVWTVPTGVDTLDIELVGADGGSYGTDVHTRGGFGADVHAVLAVTPGNRYAIFGGAPGQDGIYSPTPVATPAGGFPAGGNGGACGSGECAPGGGGGGSTGFYADDGGGNLTPILVAGGGGGGGFYGRGGNAGAVGAAGTGDDIPPGGGTQSAGGAAGRAGQGLDSGGATAGVANFGGHGGHLPQSAYTGGGGGGGYFGGGGGVDGGGGGGSNYIAPAFRRIVVGTGAGFVPGAYIKYGTADAPELTTATLPHATVGTPYSVAIPFSGFGAPNFAVACCVPPGLAVSLDGVVSGTPLAAGTSTLNVVASTGAGASILPITLTVDPAPVAPSFAAATPPVGALGHAYSYRFAATGTPAPTVTLSSGTLPPGLSPATDGTISGTPTTLGSYAFTLAATNGVAPAASHTFTIVIDGAPTANAGAATRSVNSSSTVPLDATGSTDPENEPLTYEWDQIEGAAVTVTDNKAATTNATMPAGPATVKMRLTVTNPAGLSSTADVVFTVKAPK